MTTPLYVTRSNVARIPADRLYALREGVRLSASKSPHKNCMRGKQVCGTHTCRNEPHFDKHNPDQKIEEIISPKKVFLYILVFAFSMTWKGRADSNEQCGGESGSDA